MKINKFTDNLTKKPGLFDIYFLFVQKVKRKSFKIFFALFALFALFLGYAPNILNIQTSIPNPETASRFFLTFIFIISAFCYVFVIFLINITSTETVEEKNSRAMEIIISSLPAKKHMFARIISNFLLLFSLFFFFLLINFFATLAFYQSFDGIFAFMKKVFGISGDTSVFSLYEIAGLKGDFFSFLVCSFIIIFLSSLTFLTFAASISSIPSTAQDSQYLMLPLILIPIISFTFFTSVIFEPKSSVSITILGLIPLINLCFFPTSFLYGALFSTNFDPYLIFLFAFLINLLFYLLVSFPLTLIYQQGILNYSQKAAWVQFREVIRSLKYRNKNKNNFKK